MPFYRLLQSYLPDSFVTFMVQYEATRTLSESFLESLPQTCLQVIIFIDCNGNIVFSSSGRNSKSNWKGDYKISIQNAFNFLLLLILFK